MILILKKKIKKITIITIPLIIVVALGLSTALTYVGNFSDPVSVFFKKIYPAKFVGPGYISVYYKQQGMALGQSADQMVKIKKEQNLIEKLQIPYSNSNFDQELKFDTSGKTNEYQALLAKSFFGNPQLYYDFVVKPQTYDALLRVKYNSDFSGNEAAYSRAQSILSKIQSGDSFDDLAKADSDDKLTGQLGGDLGVIPTDELLPELQEAIDQSQPGQIISHLVISRLGYHILDPIESVDQNNQKLWHVKHILIQTSGFDQWLSSQL